MIEIKDLLNKFNHILLSEEVRKESIRNIISEIINIKIQPKDIKIKNNTIYLNVKPIYKNEIFIKHDKIISELEKVLMGKKPKAIR